MPVYSPDVDHLIHRAWRVLETSPCPECGQEVEEGLGLCGSGCPRNDLAEALGAVEEMRDDPPAAPKPGQMLVFLPAEFSSWLQGVDDLYGETTDEKVTWVVRSFLIELHERRTQALFSKGWGSE